MNDLSIDDLVALKVKEELSKYDKRYQRISDGWLKLRKEIRTYIMNEMRDRTGLSFYTCQKAFYDPIKVILGISRIDEMTDEQALIARDVYLFIRNKLEANNTKRRPNHATN